MEAVKLNYKPKRKTETWGVLEHGCVEISARSIYKLNPIASFIWQQCNGDISIGDISYSLAQKCNALSSLEEIQKDVLEILETWKYDSLLIMNFNYIHSALEYNNDYVYHINANVDYPVDILLLSAPTATPMSYSGTSNHLETLGLGYLSAYLRQHDFKVGIIDLWKKQLNPNTIKEFVLKYNPQIIGISTMTDNFENGAKIARIIKEINNDIKIIFGGAHVTFRDKESLFNHNAIDIIARGEAEYTLLELANFYIHSKGELSNIDGITYRSNTDIIRTKNRELICDLDILPFPDRTKIDKDIVVGVQTSRGCPGQCIFCCASGLSGGKYRRRSANNVVNEIEILLNKGVKTIFFQDDTITVDLKRLHEIIDLIEEKKLKFRWSAESRVDVLEKDPSIIQRMVDAGCIGLQFGVESGSQKMLNALKKNIKIEQIYNAVTNAANAGLSPRCTFLIGHPFETYESISETIEFAKKLIDIGAESLISAVCPYPGTDICENPQNYGVKIKQCSYSNYNVLTPIMDTKYLTVTEIKRFYYIYTLELHQYYQQHKQGGA